MFCNVKIIDFDLKNSYFLRGFGRSYLKFNMTDYGLNFFVIFRPL